jgi:hypothetical protein
VEKQGRPSAISGGIFLIGLGVLLFTNWWWPGIMVVVGLAVCAELVFRGQIWRGIGTLVFFLAIPTVLWLIQAVRIPWGIAGPLVLIGIGVIILVKAFFLRGQGGKED